VRVSCQQPASSLWRAVRRRWEGTGQPQAAVPGPARPWQCRSWSEPTGTAVPGLAFDPVSGSAEHPYAKTPASVGCVRCLVISRRTEARFGALRTRDRSVWAGQAARSVSLCQDEPPRRDLLVPVLPRLELHSPRPAVAACTAAPDASEVTGGYARSAASSAPIPGRCQRLRVAGPGDASSPHYPRNDQ